MSEEAVTSPAQASVATESAPAAAPASEQAQASQGSAPATTAPAKSEPDWDAYLSDESTRKRLLDHPVLKKDVEHRLKSTREADVEARVQARLAAERARAQQEAETRRMLEMDSYELGEHVKQSTQQNLTRQQIESQLRQQAQVEAFGVTSKALVATMRKLGITDAELEALHPGNFKTLEDWDEARIEKLAELRADKRLKERLPAEIDARWQEHLAKQREGERGPVVSGAEGPGMTWEQVKRAYAREGKYSDEYKRLRRDRERRGEPL